MRTSTPVDFARDVYPILQRSCLECHGQKKQEGGLRLDGREAMMESGSIEPHAPHDSELLRRIMLPHGDEDVMPAIGEPLPKRQIAMIREWIEQGADWPEAFDAGEHWAYLAPQRPQQPSVSNPAWVKSPIDGFVLSRLDDEGLAPSPRAPPEKLVRRLFLDLIGLPPTPEEVTAFTSDPSDQRYEELVDDLLGRPQFGERWARPWLDLARYADSHGFQRDDLRDIWAYRDWVIRALNQDMPFDQFTIEQIAGDLLPDATESQRVATGFHRCTPTNVEAGSLPEETRTEQVIDRVNTTGAVWLGTTLECCQCHDHKYDPFTMEEYYQLLAFYNNTQLEADRTDPSKPSSIQFKGPSMPLSSGDRDVRRAELKQQLTDVQASRAARRKLLANDLDAWSVEALASLESAPRYHALDLVSFQSEGTTDSFERLEDGSILLVGGDVPDTDIYRVRMRGTLEDVRAFRLDVLQHDSLPGRGPGRGDPQRTNFILNEFSVEVKPATLSESIQAEQQITPEPVAAARKLAFASATASFSQKNWDVAGAIDGVSKTGWAISPEFEQSHWATFKLSAPLHLTPASELVFTLTQNYGKARNIGCFRISAITGNVDAESVPDEIVQLATRPGEKWNAKQRAKLLEYRAAQDQISLAFDKQITRLEKDIAQIAPDTTLVMIELDAPRATSVFQRGDYRKPGKPVTARTPAVLHPLPEGPLNRLTLARWLVSRENPLVARVTVNRFWAELFGQGIVATPEDFGIKGDLPTHPELLDWLAVEFMDNGWSMKKLLKSIVLSATYQQSSVVRGELQELDDRNRWLARGPRFRMDAEMIRDNALAISGLLDLGQFGSPIRPYQPDGIWKKVGGTAYNYEVSPGGEQHRRGIYVVLKRGSPYPSLVNFDASARLACTVQRSRTNTPLQALTLLNDPVFVAAAQSLAARVLQEKADATLDEQLVYAFQLCTARTPTVHELGSLRRLHTAQWNAKRGTAALDKESQSDRKAESEAWYSIASVLLNLHETITKD